MASTFSSAHPTIDFFKQKVFSLKNCEVVILDEADRMFDLGFIDDMRYLLNRCPEPDKRLSLLFSATLSHRVSELAYVHMNDPAEIRIQADTKTADKIEQSIYYPANAEKIPLLLGLMKKLKPTRSIVFINTKRVADKVYAWLEGNGYKSALLSGDVPQKKRQTLLKNRTVNLAYWSQPTLLHADCIPPQSATCSTLTCHNQVKTTYTVSAVLLAPVPVVLPLVLPAKTSHITSWISKSTSTRK